MTATRPAPARSRALPVALLAVSASLLLVDASRAQDAEPARERAARPAAEEAPERASRDAAVQQLQQRLRAGEVTRDEARALYVESLLPAWVAERFLEAVRPIDAGVAEQRVTAEEARTRKLAVASELRAAAFSMEVLGMTAEEAKLALAVQSGSVTREQAARARGDRAARGSAWMYEPLAAADVRPELLGDVVGLVERLVPMVREQGDAFVLPEAFGPKLAELQLTDEQTAVVLSLARKAASMPTAKRLDLRWMRQPLREAGVPGDALADVLATVETLVGVTLKGGDARAPMNAEFKAWFRERGLTPPQLQTIQGLVVRAVEDEQQKQQGIASHFARLGIDERSLAGAKTRLIEAGIRGDVLEPTLGVLLRASVEAAKEGAAFELDPAYASDLTGRGLSPEQVGTVRDVAAHLGKTLRASRGRDDAKAEGDRGRAGGEREQR